MGVAVVGGLSLFGIFSAPVSLGMSCAYGMDADIMGAWGLGGPLDGVMPDLLPSRSSLAYFSATSSCLIASASRRAPASCPGGFGGVKLCLGRLSMTNGFKGVWGLGMGITCGNCFAFVMGCGSVICLDGFLLGSGGGGLFGDLSDPRFGL